MENKVLGTVEGVEGVGPVEITEAMVKVFAKRHGTEYSENNLVGLIGSVAGYVHGGAGGEDIGNLSGDAFLFESPETREMFAPVRRAFEIRTMGHEKPESQFSNVSILEVIPEWHSFKETL
jgi:hypothetical protein